MMLSRRTAERSSIAAVARQQPAAACCSGGAVGHNFIGASLSPIARNDRNHRDHDIEMHGNLGSVRLFT